MGGVLLGMVLVKGFVEVGYILGQSYVDSFVQLAEVAIHQVHKTADVPEEPTTPNPS
jgi:flagellar motor component MotA